MGAPKQKWTSEEEAALKAGIAKYGLGKWSTILKDPRFSATLHLRSNVDLKDKWRNMNVFASGMGSRHRFRLATKSTQETPKHDDNSMTNSPIVEEIVYTKPLATSRGPLENVISHLEPLAISHGPLQNVCSDVKPPAISQGRSQNVSSKIPISRLDNLILEAITNLKEPNGSNRTSIAMFIEEQYLAPPNFERLLATNLKLLTEHGKLIKVKHQYRIAPSSTSFGSRKDSFPSLEGNQKDCPRVEKNQMKMLTKAQFDAEVEMMRHMTPQQAATAAAQAVAEAEAAIAAAEEAAREAEEAEAEAEVAQCLADAAAKALKCKAIRAW